MYSYVFFTLTLCARAAVFELTPDRDAYVWLQFDGFSNSNLTKWALTETASQLRALAAKYEAAGYALTIGASMHYPYTDEIIPTCARKYPQGALDEDFLSYLTSFFAESAGDHGSTATPHGTQAQIVDLLEETSDLDSQTGRRVIVFYTDVAEDFGANPGELGCVRACDKTRWVKSIQKAGYGILHCTLAQEKSTASGLQSRVNGLYRSEALLADFFVDENNRETGLFDTVEWHLARMLSPSMIPSTSTSTVDPVAAAIKQCLLQALNC